MRRRQFTQSQAPMMPQASAQSLNPVTTNPFQSQGRAGLGQIAKVSSLPSAGLLKKKGWPKGKLRKPRAESYS